jgi:dihydroorotase
LFVFLGNLENKFQSKTGRPGCRRRLIESGRISVRGLLVTPGLIDIHTHDYAGTGRKGAYDGDSSVYPDDFTFRSCVTTVVDAGSSGWRNFPDFKDRVIDRSKTRVLAFLNIVGSGMDGDPVEQNTQDMDSPAAAAMAKQYPNIIVGFKTAHFEGPEWTAVDHALEAGKLAGLPVMVDFGRFRPERRYEELVGSRFRPGDISTHMYLDFIHMLDASGKVLPYLFEAKKRGVIFDVGHGGGSFVFNQAARRTPGFSARFHFYGLARWQHERGNEGHVERHVEILELWNVCAGHCSSLYVESSEGNQA